MVSRPSANRGSHSREKTGSCSRCSSGSKASPHRGLSALASRAMASQRSGEEVTDRRDRPVDLLVAVREGEEHGLELRGRYIDPALEQVTEEGAVPLRVAPRGVVEVCNRLL